MMYSGFEERKRYVFTKDGRRIEIDEFGNMVRGTDPNQKKYRGENKHLTPPKKKRKK